MNKSILTEHSVSRQRPLFSLWNNKTETWN